MPLSQPSLANITELVSTAVPNNVTYAISLAPKTSATNADIVVSPKGTGALLTQLPDNLTFGGNKRGQRAVDLQLSRNSAAQVASGSYAVVSGGANNTASGNYSFVGSGDGNTAAQLYAFVGGGTGNTASGAYSAVTGGITNTASGTYSVVLCGYTNTANGMASACLSGNFGNVNGVAGRAVFGIASASESSGKFQGSKMVLAVSTSTATPLALTTIPGTVTPTTQVTLVNYSALAFSGLVVAKQQTAGVVGAWKIEGVLTRGAGAATTVLAASTVSVISNASGLDVTLSADTTNGGLSIKATGLASTNIQFCAFVDTVETVYP